MRRRTVYRGRVVDLHVDTVRLPGGQTQIREVVGHQPAVAIVPCLPDGRIVLVRQFRYAVGRRLWELPAGISNRGEPPRDSAARELREETGYRAGRLRLLGVIYSSPGFCRERIHLYLADRLRRVGPLQLDEDERLLPRAWPVRQALELIRRGRIMDGKTVLGLCWIAGGGAQGPGRFHIARNLRAGYTTPDVDARRRRRRRIHSAKGKLP